MCAGGQHGDDRLGALGGLGRGGDGEAAGGLGAIERLRRQIEGADVMALLRQIGGHAAAHIAQPDETDARHFVSSPNHNRNA